MLQPFCNSKTRNTSSADGDETPEEDVGEVANDTVEFPLDNFRIVSEGQSSTKFRLDQLPEGSSKSTCTFLIDTTTSKDANTRETRTNQDEHVCL